LIEFTGERVIPGEVDVDLWNEHLARYAFAARLTAGKRVLDAGCGSGYGTAALAETASGVTGVDVAADAIAYAREHYSAPHVQFAEGSCAALPVADGSADVVVAFEVIEHLADWRAFLHEVCRVLAPDGLLVISTPNKDYYAESRRLSGPNPYHVHEFDSAEFVSELKALFAQVDLYLENHVEGIAFQPAGPAAAGQPELRQAASGADPATAHFFLAVCARSPHSAPAPFIYVPSAANILHERELHIDKLEIDVRRLREEKEGLVEMFRVQKAELEESNRWAHDLDEKLTAKLARIVELQSELQQTATGYEAKVAELEGDNRIKTEWAQQVDADLKRCVEFLHAAEKTVEERTEWALRVQGELDIAQGQLNGVRDSRWVKLGNRVGVGPQLLAK
jgi:ubiquinone/menaquinone biosynthesis C-methylase UbiE